MGRIENKRCKRVPVRLGEILPDVMRNIKARMDNKKRKNNETI